MPGPAQKPASGRFEAQLDSHFREKIEAAQRQVDAAVVVTSRATEEMLMAQDALQAAEVAAAKERLAKAREALRRAVQDEAVNRVRLTTVHLVRDRAKRELLLAWVIGRETGRGPRGP